MANTSPLFMSLLIRKRLLLAYSIAKALLGCPGRFLGTPSIDGALSWHQVYVRRAVHPGLHNTSIFSPSTSVNRLTEPVK